MQKEDNLKKMHLSIKKYPLLFGFILLFTTVSQAQVKHRQDTIKAVHDSITNLNVLETVHLKGNNPAEQVEQQGFSVNSISTAKYKATNADLTHILDEVPGVRILQDGGLGSGFKFTLNGFSGDQVKIFIDGIPIDHYSAAFGLNNISVNSIQRIDTYKGVVPVSLGTDALGGAVNIITNKTWNFFDASYSYGSFNTHRASVNGAYTNPKTGFTARGSLNYNYSDNDYKVYVPIVENNQISHYADVKRFHNRYRSGNIRAEAGWVNRRFADQLLFGIIAAKDDQQVQNGSTMASPYGAIINKSHTIAPSLKYEKKNIGLPGLDVNLYATYNLSKTKIIDTLTGLKYNWLGETISVPGNKGEFYDTYNTLDDKELNTGLNVSYQIADYHALVANYSLSTYKREVFDREHPQKIANQFPKSLTKNVVGLAYKFNYHQKWKATAFSKYYAIRAKGSKEYDFGLPTHRTDAFKETKSSFGYGVAGTYFPIENLQLKASYEHTYRMPTANEMFGDGLFVEPNTDLGPEQSDNINVGAAYQFSIHQNNHFSVQSNFVYRDAQDLIHQVVKVSSPVTHYANLNHTRTLGVSGSLGYRWKNVFHLNANLTFQDITDQAALIYNDSFTNTGYQPNFHKGYRVPNIPYLFGNISAGLKFKNVLLDASTLRINYHFNYVHDYFLTWAELGSKDSKKVIPSQSSHDLEFTYSIKHYSLSFEVRNLTNERLYDKYFLQKPGRAFYIKLRYTL